MKRLSLGCALLFVGVMAAQPPEVKPGPEHEVLKGLVGTWVGKFKMQGMESDCRCVYRNDLGGLWVSSNFTTKFGDQNFSGRGFDTYDAGSKKYTSIWIDSMTTKPMIMNGTYDAATKTMTMTGEGPGPDGKMQKMKIVSTMPDKDTMTSKMFNVSDGGETEMFTIEYKRTADQPRRGKGNRKAKAEAKPAP